ncbi:MAG TPA: methionyl-tRNA formyltransferase [Candidatus Omnitrophota bacterium]|nr:methionyl-tRNA formyltransferase [Candidatus Omnitrophota bacterium]
MKIIFFGSDEFSIKALEACLHSGEEIALVITTPAKKKGRGLRLETSEVFRYCYSKNIPTAEFPTLKDPQIEKKILTLQPDAFVVASYGKLIPPHLLTIPKYRLNVHPSLLPKYRGASPVNFPILNGDKETGVTILDIAEKMDAGDIYAQEKFILSSRINAQDLSNQLAALGYGVLKKVLQQIKTGKLQGISQNEKEATFAPQLVKKDGEFSFRETAEEIDRKVRGLQPWPGCYFFCKGERISLLEVDRSDLTSNQTQGTIVSIEKDGRMNVATGKDVLALVRVKPEGKNTMSAADFARGRRLSVGMVLD